MTDNYEWFPAQAQNPCFRRLISHENNTLVFDGYFSVKKEKLPVQRVMVNCDEHFIDSSGNRSLAELVFKHIEIYDRISGENTSVYGCDNFTDLSGNDADSWDDLDPTEIITLKYRIITDNVSHENIKGLIETIRRCEERVV